MPIELSDADRKELLQDYIPQQRFEEATGKLNDQIKKSNETVIRLEEQVKGLQQSQASSSQETPQVTYSRAQLREFVDSEELSQEQSDALWDRQLELKTDEKIKAAVVQASSSTDRKLTTQELSSKVGAYIELLPDLKVDDSDDRNKVAKEYDALARVMGEHPRGSEPELKTQLAALERAFGPVDKLRGKLKSRSEDRETMESLGGGEGSDMGDIPKTGALKDLTVDRKAYYQKGIDAGRYKNWDAVKAELEYKRKE